MSVRLGLLLIALGGLLATTAAGDEIDLSPLVGLRQRLDASPRAERELWDALLALGERSLAAKSSSEDWKAIGTGREKPILISGETPVKAKILAGWTEKLPSFEANYRVWIVPGDGAAYLVAFPDGGLIAATSLLERLDANLTVQPEDNREIRQEKDRLRRLLLSGMGRRPEAWFVTVVRLHPGPGKPFGKGPVRVAIKGERLVLTPTGGRSVAVERPGAAQLGQWIGRPFAPPGEAGPVQAGGRVYVAVDWSAYLASPDRQSWLLGELKHALRDVSPDVLVGEAIHLHAGKNVADWPLADVQRGVLSDDIRRGVAAHTNQTLETLSEVVTQAERQKATIARLYFLTWNPAISIPMDVRESDLRQSPAHADLVAKTAKVPLVVVQVFETRLRCLVSLAGKHYYTVPFTPMAEPRLTLPQWDE